MSSSSSNGWSVLTDDSQGRVEQNGDRDFIYEVWSGDGYADLLVYRQGHVNFGAELLDTRFSNAMQARQCGDAIIRDNTGEVL